MRSGHYVHDIDPFFIKFGDNCFIEGIRWYGIFYVLAFIFAIFALRLYSKSRKSQLSPDQNASLLNYIILGVIIGGRVGYMLLYDFGEFIKRPFEVFAVWHGGMSSHGGFIGVIIAVLIFCKKSSLPVLHLFDLCSTVAPFGFFLGRIANFINGELYGKITNVPWAVIFPKSAPYLTEISAISARHPSQLYEGFLEGLVLFLYMQIRFWRKKSLPPGCLSAKFLMLYAIFRIFSEIFREPDAELILGMSRGQFYSIILLITGLILNVFIRKNGIEK